jgi:chromosome segregation ATPase
MALMNEEIWQAASALDAEGTKPTLAAVRKKLGRGSFTTIQEAMSEWKHRQQNASTAMNEPPPPEVSDRACALAADLWMVALSAADRALAGERQRMADEVAKLHSQLAEAAEIADELGDDVERLMRELADAHSHCSTQNFALAELKEAQRTDAREAEQFKASAATAAADAKEARSAEKVALHKAGKAEGEIKALREQVASFSARLEPRVVEQEELDLVLSPSASASQQGSKA